MLRQRGQNYKASMSVKLNLVFFAVVLPSLLASAAILQPWWPAEELFSDFLTVAEKSDDCCHVYYGSISYIGILLFMTASAVGLFSFFIFWAQKRNTQLVIFALTSGVLSGWLGLDDLFMLHETVFPKLGVQENFVIFAYVILTLIYVIYSWRIILSSEFWIIVLGGLFLAASIFIDVFVHEQVAAYGPYESIEDALKLIGISCWTCFHVSTLAIAIINHQDPETGHEILKS